jgi:lipoprotein-releasing system permease protein
MKYKLVLEVAFSLLTARLKQTLVAATGVTFGIAMFITLLSFMTGLNDLLDGLIVNRTPHIRLYNEIKPPDVLPIDLVNKTDSSYHFVRSLKPKTERAEIYNSAAIIRTLQADNRVKGVAPRLITQVFFNVGEVELTGALNGIDVEEEARLFFFRDYVTTGNFQDLRNIPNSAILGKGLADKMLAKIGDVIPITTSKGERISLKVVGYFESGLQDYDKVNSFVSLATTQKIMGVSGSYITDLQVKLYELETAPTLAKEFHQLFGVEALDIQTANSQFETGTFIRTLISYVVGIVLLVVAGFGIYNILNMMIYEKMDSIAILKATGFSGQDVKFTFISIALSIGILGGGVGLLLGFGLSAIIDQIPFNTAALPTVKTYPINYNPKYYFIATIFSIVSTYLAGFFPAIKASKIDPVEIIRGK